MYIHIVLCVAAILTVTQSTPIAFARKNVEDEGIINQKVANHVQNPADFVAVKTPRSKRQNQNQYGIDLKQPSYEFQRPYQSPFQTDSQNSYGSNHLNYPSAGSSSGSGFSGYQSPDKLGARYSADGSSYVGAGYQKPGGAYVEAGTGL
jgi:hypothetical protein